MDGAAVATPVTSRAYFWGKRLLLPIGVATVFIITVTAISVWYLSQDEFDYANEEAPQLKIDSDHWTVIDWSSPMTINVHQAEAVFYWHDKNQIAWKCGNSESLKELNEDILTIRHNHCFVFLPIQMSSIKVNQGSAVFVRPQANIQVNLYQGGLRIAENGAQYYYQYKGDENLSNDFQSHLESDILITIDAEDSGVKRYQY
jgi:hypothetical protein